MHSEYVKKIKRLWADPETRERTLAGSRKAVAALKARDPRDRRLAALRGLRTKQLKRGGDG